MGVKFFDHNLDGRMDLFVTDMHSDMTGAQIKSGREGLQCPVREAEKRSVVLD